MGKLLQHTDNPFWVDQRGGLDCHEDGPQRKGSMGWHFKKSGW